MCSGSLTRRQASERGGGARPGRTRGWIVNWGAETRHARRRSACRFCSACRSCSDLPLGSSAKSATESRGTNRASCVGMSEQQSVLVVIDGSESAQAPRSGPRASFANKVRGVSRHRPRPELGRARHREQGAGAVPGQRAAVPADAPVADIDDELAALMRRAPCPLWTIQPGPRSPRSSSRGGSRSGPLARGPGRRARCGGDPAAIRIGARLILVHGLRITRRRSPQPDPGRTSWLRCRSEASVDRAVARELAGPV